MLGVNKWLRSNDGRREGVVKTKRMNMVLPSPSRFGFHCVSANWQSEKRNRSKFLSPKHSMSWPHTMKCGLDKVD